MRNIIFLLAVIIIIAMPATYAQEWELKWPTYSKELKQKAKTDDNAYVDLAICYGYGLGVKADKKKCRKMFEETFGFTLYHQREVGSRYPYASLWYGIFMWDNSIHSEYLGWKSYGYDQNTIIDHLKWLSISYIEFAAETGLEDAEIMYARANRGNTSRCNCVAIRMWNPDMVPLSMTNFGYYEKAKEWYDKACQHGNPIIMLEYAKYLNSMAAYGYQNDEAELAYYWYKTAAEYGNAEAQRLYAWYFENGIFESESLAEAAKWYVKAANQGDAEAAGLAGRAMLLDSSMQDKTIALDYLNKGTEQGNGLAAYQLGSCYESGEYLERDYNRALECFTISAAADNVDGLYALGNFYENGYGCEINMKKAAEAYEKCANLNSSNIHVGQAALKIADMYERGTGVFMNKKKAQDYREIAAQYKIY